MTVEITPGSPKQACNPRYSSACRGCSARFSFLQSDAERTYSFPNHVLTLACPGCGMKLTWALPPHPLKVESTDGPPGDPT